MTTAVSAPSGTLLAKFLAIRDFLREHNVEREEEIEVLTIALIGGFDLLFLGEPGVGKTHIIELLTDHCIAGDVRLFTHLLAKDQSASEVLGPKDVMAMKQGVEQRMMDGYLPTSHLAYLDEIFKASPPMLNPLLDIFANRKLKVGGNVFDCGQLLTILASSNELPDREDLAAFRDRIALTKLVEDVRTPEGRKQVSRIQLNRDVHGIDASHVDPLTLDDISAIRGSVQAVAVSDQMIDTMDEVEHKCREAGHKFTQRRKGHMWWAVKARAWTRGSDTVSPDDFLIAQHMAWNHPDHRKSARNIITDIASEYTRKAMRLREAMEAVEQQVKKLQDEANLLDEDAKLQKMNEGFKFLTQLKQLRSQARDQIKQGRTEGQDVSMTETVLDEIQRAQKWVSAYLSGVDEDDDDI